MGILGGVVGLIIVLALFLLGQLGIILIAEGSGIVQFLSFVIPVSGLVGGTIVKSRTLIAAILMGVSGILICVFLQGVHFFSLLSGTPLIIGGMLAIISTNKDHTSQIDPPFQNK